MRPTPPTDQPARPSNSRRAIRVLERALVDQIAAGEVVERPASAVKELVENALDAGAENLRVETELGGSARIQVVDDGHGIPRNELELATVRHATSKILTLDDLIHVASMGFRGEALPSIASVSHLTLVSRTAEETEGTRVEIHGGDRPTVRPVGAPIGTSVEVRGLFYNVPARKKFLKGPATENAHIAETCLRVALLDPRLRLTLIRDGRTVREYLPVADTATRVQGAFREEPLRWFEGERDDVRVSAMLGPPERARRGTKGLHLFVNRRAVRDRALARAVAFAYGSVLAPGHFPVGAVYVELEHDRVDVNVHPQKTEVRFRDGRRVYDNVTRFLAARLGTTPWGSFRNTGSDSSASRPIPLERDVSFWDTRLSLENTASRDPSSPAPSLENPTAQGVADSPSAFANEGRSPAETPSLDASTGTFGRLRVLAQVRKMILVCEGEHGLCFIDQHAADERVRFARLKQSYDAREVSTQRLLFPERIELTPTETAVVEERAEAIRAIGLDTSIVGPTTIAVHAIPSVLSRATPERLLRDLVTELNHGDRAFGDRVDMALATMACHAAIRAGDVLSLQEGQALLEELDRVEDFAGYCPHGRPVVMTIPFHEIERKLGR